VSDSLAPNVVKPLLRGRFGHIYRYAEITDSTQRMLAENEAEGAVAAAEEQTEGRGRLGRAWEAPTGTSVLASVLLLPVMEASRLPELSLVAGGAVAQAIGEVTGLEPAIKFPNDVLVGGRKVAGILAESSEGRVVLGIGVNVNQALGQLPTDARIEPTSLRLELGEPVSRAQLLAVILLQLEHAYDAWVSTTGTSASG
jgi:BirA family transcriptional regulator, biotin operon repressor / biotin---[acetyl-CoA-carboxylase] ligase